jgi:hypothetical protein
MLSSSSSPAASRDGYEYPLPVVLTFKELCLRVRPLLCTIALSECAVRVEEMVIFIETNAERYALRLILFVVHDP